MRHVALFQNVVTSCWPILAADAYKEKYGPEAFRAANNGREAVFLGEWLYQNWHNCEFVDSIEDVDVNDGDRIYAVRNSNVFAWNTGYDTCEVKVVEVLDDEHWIIEYEDYGCREKLVVISEADEYGYMRTVRVAG